MVRLEVYLGEFEGGYDKNTFYDIIKELIT